MSGNKQVIAAFIKRAALANDGQQCVAIAEKCASYGMRYDDIASIAALAGVDAARWDALLYEGESEEGDE